MQTQTPSPKAAQLKIRRAIELILSDDNATVGRIVNFVADCDRSGFVADDITENHFDALWDRCTELDDEWNACQEWEPIE